MTKIPAQGLPAAMSTSDTLWHGELDSWMDMKFLNSLWQAMVLSLPQTPPVQQTGRKQPQKAAPGPGDNDEEGESLKVVVEAAQETVTNVKVIRDRFTGLSAGYAFITFSSHELAARCLDTFNNSLIPGTTNNTFKLNWATGGSTSGMATIATSDATSSSRLQIQNLHQSGGLGGAASPSQEYSLFVGDLGAEVTDAMLLKLFLSHYHSTKSAKIVQDTTTLASKGYGFVRMADEEEWSRALVEMGGTLCGSRPIRVSIATPKHQFKLQKAAAAAAAAAASSAVMGGGPSSPMFPYQLATDPYAYPSSPSNSTYTTPNYTNYPYHPHPPFPITYDEAVTAHLSGDGGNVNNTTVFVGGLTSFVTEEDLESQFKKFGEIIYVKIPQNHKGGCAFIAFRERESAVRSIREMAGVLIGGNPIRIAWGNSFSYGQGNNYYNQQQQYMMQQQQQQQQMMYMQGYGGYRDYEEGDLDEAVDPNEGEKSYEEGFEEQEGMAPTPPPKDITPASSSATLPRIKTASDETRQRNLLSFEDYPPLAGIELNQFKTL